MLYKFPATPSKKNTPTPIFVSLIIYLFLGHWLAMRSFNYQDTAIFFVPFLGAMVTGSKRNLSESQSALIILAGLLPGFLLGWLFFQVGSHTPLIPNHTISWVQIGWLMVVLNGVNLLPVYPVDGGQLLNQVYWGEEGRISNAYIIFSCLSLTAVVLPVILQLINQSV
ncbi:MAG: hypothetical protein FJY16_03015 [Bacteroidetes bacterium]|nr:hypothetical protein [Bacteroidota bacterium]